MEGVTLHLGLGLHTQQFLVELSVPPLPMKTFVFGSLHLF